VVFPWFFVILLLGDSYPEICAQRDAEGEGFPFVVAEAGPAAASAKAGFFVTSTYPLGMKDNKQESFIHLLHAVYATIVYPLHHCLQSEFPSPVTLKPCPNLYSGAPGSEKCLVVRIVRSLQPKFPHIIAPIHNPQAKLHTITTSQ
jgi:hypothetical protein